MEEDHRVNSQDGLSVVKQEESEVPEMNAEPPSDPVLPPDSGQELLELETSSCPVKTESSDTVPTQSSNDGVATSSTVENKINDCSNELKTQVPKPKGKKKKKAPLDPSAPRQPLSGYMRYLNDRRETVRGSNPSLSFADITKLLAEEWNHLSQDKKQPYLEAGQLDRERYTREFNAYKQTEAYRIASQIQSEKKARKLKENLVENGLLSDCNEVPPEVPKKDPGSQGNDINIFTDDFLELNRAREAELRQLRNQTTEFEEQNALLEKHNGNLKAALDDIEKTNKLLRMSNEALQQHLEVTRTSLVQGFAQVVLPGWDKPPTVDNMFEYMTHLQKYITDNSDSKCDQIMAQISTIVEKSEFNI